MSKFRQSYCAVVAVLLILQLIAIPAFVDGTVESKSRVKRLALFDRHGNALAEHHFFVRAFRELDSVTGGSRLQNYQRLTVGRERFLGNWGPMFRTNYLDYKGALSRLGDDLNEHGANIGESRLRMIATSAANIEAKRNEDLLPGPGFNSHNKVLRAWNNLSTRILRIMSSLRGRVGGAGGLGRGGGLGGRRGGGGRLAGGGGRGGRGR